MLKTFQRSDSTSKISMLFALICQWMKARTFGTMEMVARYALMELLLAIAMNLTILYLSYVVHTFLQALLGEACRSW